MIQNILNKTWLASVNKICRENFSFFLILIVWSTITCNGKTKKFYCDVDANNIVKLSQENIAGTYISAKLGEETFEITLKGDSTFIYSFKEYGCTYKQLNGTWYVDGVIIHLIVQKERNHECGLDVEPPFTNWEPRIYNIKWKICSFMQKSMFTFVAQGSNVLFEMRYYEQNLN